jgi:hypothetical protein
MQLRAIGTCHEFLFSIAMVLTTLRIKEEQTAYQETRDTAI